MIIVNEVFLKQLFRAANSMVLELHIKEGDSLAFVLGQPDADTNKEAICLWLLGYVPNGTICMDRYSQLKAKLSCILSELQGSQLA